MLIQTPNISSILLNSKAEALMNSHTKYPMQRSSHSIDALSRSLYPELPLAYLLRNCVAAKLAGSLPNLASNLHHNKGTRDLST